MAISKLIFNDTVQMDVTGTTAVASDVASGKAFTLVDGTEGTGTASGGSAQDFINLMATQDFPSGEIVITDVTWLKDRAFQSRQKITKVSSTSLTSLDSSNYAFDLCPLLKEANFPNVTTASSGGYQFCSSHDGSFEKINKQS